MTFFIITEFTSNFMLYETPPNKNRDIYLFKENEFIKLSYENNANFKILSKHLGCKI